MNDLDKEAFEKCFISLDKIRDYQAKCSQKIEGMNE